MSACPTPNYSHIEQTPKRYTSVALQLNYVSDIILESKADLAKIKTKIKEVKEQLHVFHLLLINEVRHSRKSNLGVNTPFQRKYVFQNLKNKIFFPKHDIKIKKELEKLLEKTPEKEEKEQGIEDEV